MRSQTSNFVASSYRRGRGRKDQAWFARALDINHTGPTNVWANRQSFSEETDLPLESFVPTLVKQSDIPYETGKIVLSSGADRSVLHSPIEKMNPGGETLNFADSEAWPALKTVEDDRQQQPSDYSFVYCSSCQASESEKQVFEPKYMRAAPADSEWMFLTNRHLYIDIVKRKDANEITKEHDFTESIGIEAKGYASDSANWTLLENDSASSSSYLSEEEDGLGETMKSSPQTTGRNTNTPGSSMFSFLW